MLIRIFMAVIVTVAGLAPAAASVADTITIRETAGAAVANAPIQIGRAFVAGEVPNFPRAVVAGTPVTTQADVKCRWSDGSVKHAVISFMLPSLAANASVSVAFVDQASGNNTAQTQAQMLAPSFDFDAVMRLTSGGTTVTASGRTMLANGDYTTWANGPIATTVVLADHSTARRYDIGFDANRSFRPIVHATFWPTIGKVHVRFIGEAANTTAMQDLNYALGLSVGSSSPQNVYSKASVAQGAASRWTKDFWIGGAPQALAIDHNLAYLVQTYALPNYDTTKSYNGVTAAWNNWNSAAKDLYGAGNWTIYMPTTGGRPDIAIYPDWTMGWLYTFDPKMQQVAFGQADLAAAWPVHFREGSAKRGTATRFFDRARTVSPIGRPLSINARPTFTSGTLNWYINSPAANTDPLDYVNVVGPWGVNPWEPESRTCPIRSPRNTCS
ncbi:MAG: hypothetical protein H0W83_12035, partial [Planctomycetes bacterium]|nr:hypothetical protein [Planctomycetota bacterium]